MYKVSCLNPIAQVGLDLFSPAYEIVNNIKDADMVLVRSTNMHELELPDTLLAVARAGAGVNNIPIDECSAKGTVVFNTPGANANGVKELVIAALIIGARNISDGISWVKSIQDEPEVDKLVEKGKKRFAGNELMGKKIGVIGLGAIGIRVANACEALGMDVIGYDPYLSVAGAWNISKSIKYTTSLEEIYSQCDFITLHLPSLQETKGMMCTDSFNQMKDGVIIVNFSRDTLVNDDCMAEALKSGKIKKYITDFPNEKVVKLENVIAIPHLGASTEESEENCAIMAVNELIDYIEYGNITNSVNYPNCDMGNCLNVERIVINHDNKPNMIGQFTEIFASEEINISNMLNKSKCDNAYSMFDLDCSVSELVLYKLKEVEGVKRVRVIKAN